MLDEKMTFPMYPVSIEGNLEKVVKPGEFFATDPIELSVESGEYLCLEIVFSGEMIPNHPESLIPAYRRRNGQWVASKEMPYPGMIGCDRKTDVKIGFLGDSITQGCGTQINSYTHWNAQLSEYFGEKYAFWNLGIGYGRAADAASDGAWLYKAKQNHVVLVCYGVNDILQGYSAERIKINLTEIVAKLQRAGVKVILQTIPPFDYQEDQIAIWLEVNRYIREELGQKADLLFDTVPFLCKDPQHSWCARYGGHPDAEGCTVWAKQLYPELKQFIEQHF